MDVGSSIKYEDPIEDDIAVDFLQAKFRRGLAVDGIMLGGGFLNPGNTNKNSDPELPIAELYNNNNAIDVPKLNRLQALTPVLEKPVSSLDVVFDAKDFVSSSSFGNGPPLKPLFLISTHFMSNLEVNKIIEDVQTCLNSVSGISYEYLQSDYKVQNMN